jgi:hypothetical protein
MVVFVELYTITTSSDKMCLLCFAVNQAWAGEQGTVFAQSMTHVTLRETCVKNTVCDNHGKGADPGSTVPSWQAWYKPLPGNGAAIFIANHANTPQNITIDFSAVPGLGPAPTCPTQEFPRNLNDLRCFGLKLAPLINGKPVATAGDCCAVCAMQGARCETYQFCAANQSCADGGGEGCYVGKMGKCKSSTDGWVSYARDGTAPPTPAPAPPAHPKMFAVTDVWEQAAVPGQHSSWSVNALASHDSIFITLSPA